MMRLSYGVALCVLLALECVRALGVWPLGEALQGFMAAHLDSRDAGPLICTHLYLLMGCAVPAFLAWRVDNNNDALGGGYYSSSSSSTTAVDNNDTHGGYTIMPSLVPFAGLLVLGVGDAACWPAGEPNAHYVVNHSDVPCSYLIVGTRLTHDICHYPDHGQVLHTEGETWRIVGEDGTQLADGKVPDH